MNRRSYDHPRSRQDFASVQIEAGSPGTENPSGPLPVCSQSTIPMDAPVNQDEADFHDYHGNFHKGLQHDSYGLVDRDDYAAMTAVLSNSASTGADYEKIPLDRGRVLVDPQAGRAKDVEGPDPAMQPMRPAPTCNSSETAVEAMELWLCARIRRSGQLAGTSAFCPSRDFRHRASAIEPSPWAL